MEKDTATVQKSYRHLQFKQTQVLWQALSKLTMKTVPQQMKIAGAFIL